MVGFADGALRQGFKAVGCQFAPIAGDTIPSILIL